MVKLNKKLSKHIKNTYYKDKPLVVTKDKNNKKLEEELKKIEADIKLGVLVAKIRANKAHFRKDYGAKFDEWFAKVQKHPTILKQNKQYLDYLKKLRQDTKFNHDNGTLTPKEYSELKGERKDKYIKLVVDNPTLFAFYITIVSPDNVWWNKRPTKENLKHWSKEREEEVKARDKTWWSPLTDAQKHFILTNTKKGDTWNYMGKPLSTPNIWAMKEYISRNQGIMSLLNTKDNLKKLKIVDHIAPLKILQSQRERAGATIQALLAKEKKVLDTIRVNFPHDAQAVLPTRGRGDIEIKNLKKADTIATQHGLNSFKARNKITKNTDIAGVYLQQLEAGKLDYYVDSFQNAVALAEAVGMMPQELFKTLCTQIVKRKPYLDKQQFLATGNAVAELTDAYKQAQTDLTNKWGVGKVTQKDFYNSKARKEWSKRYDINWPSYKRFNEDFTDWLKITSAVAKKKQ